MHPAEEAKGGLFNNLMNDSLLSDDNNDAKIMKEDRDDEDAESYMSFMSPKSLKENNQN